MKTAIQLVAQNILDIKTLNLEQVTEIVNILSMAMEKEKQQIIDAYHINPENSIYLNTGIKYYDSKFGDHHEAGI